MAFVTKIKWVVLSVISLSVASIIIHLSLAKLWTVNIVPYRAIAAFPDDFSSVVGRQVGSYHICICCLCMVKMFCLSFKHIFGWTGSKGIEGEIFQF
jgi:hypothetical protein